ncbi:MAG: site-specific DNA-methyltransferase [Leptolyngbya sp. PLA2]|nr:site-specific DNA-methyltransferase [Leptolyngbya sp.]MCE7970833.1 site-specific DNA-methyltransferase [Leptolyngbya sp. PL-A2]MCQ3939988.1 site-specific DNA-methyltransferase [cyanobacterium CYA1]MDL1903268.1 site-specific DNA-methyltransferase [Synechococcales cyanobacterium CNB]
MLTPETKPKREYSPRPNARRKPPVEVQADRGHTPSVPLVPEDLYGRVTTGDALHLLRRLPDRCADLVILDPPYWKVVGETWDYKWRTEEDYRAWCREWFAEVARVCKRSASLYLFGYVRNLVYLFHDIVSLGFEFRQELIVDKGIKCIAGRKTSTYKQFPNTTETIFFFVYDAKPAIRQVLLARAKELGLSAKEINSRLGVKSNGGGVWSLYTGENILAQVPTPEMWERLESVLDFKAPDDLKGFVFQPQMGLTNVWQDIDFYAEDRIHRTQKPVRLIERLALASSTPGQVILDPFAGSGTSAVVAKMLGRKCIAFEIDPEMAERANKRLAGGVAKQNDLFGK